MVTTQETVWRSPLISSSTVAPRFICSYVKNCRFLSKVHEKLVTKSAFSYLLEVGTREDGPLGSAS